MTDHTNPQLPERPNPEMSFEHLYTPDHLRRRREAVAKQEGELWKGVDDSDPKCPAGHARGIRISVSITSNYRRTHKKDAMDIQPQDVIDVLIAAGIKKWVLMGLHGYVGYLPQPRATQDVDVLIRQSDRKRAVKAVHEAWPMLVVEELEPVVRFKDPADCFNDGRPKPVIDLMLAWSDLNEAILKESEYVVLDEETQHVVPTVEAALASKYAALISDYRELEKKEYDAGDFRRIALANYDQVRREPLRRLGDLVWNGGGAELEEFLELAYQQKPFPV